MAKRYYLATRKDRDEQAAAVEAVLKTQGWERTFTWSGDDKGGTQEHSEAAIAELAAIRDADVLIVLMPGGRGTHVEIGVALALGKPVILHSPDQKTLDTPYLCVFHYHPGVKRLISEVLNVDDLLALLPQ